MPLKIVQPRPDKASQNFYIRGSYLGITVDRSAKTSKRSVALSEMRKLEGQIERGEYPPKPEQPDAPTFLSAAVAYMKAGRSRLHVAKLIEYFRVTPLEAIDQKAIDAAAVAIYPDVQPATRNRRVYTPVAAILHHANVNIKVRRPKGAKGRTISTWLTPDDAFAVIGAAEAEDAEMGRLLTFLLYTGCRIGEALKLDWADVQLAEFSARIGETKNGDPRMVGLRADVCDMLRPFKKESGKVFRYHYGGWMKFKLTNAKLAACGLPVLARPARGKKLIVPPHRLRWVNFHTFCHTWATWMRRYGGADVHGLVETGRWRDPKSAARYAHAVVSEEWARTDLMPSRGKSVDLPVRKAKTK